MSGTDDLHGASWGLSGHLIITPEETMSDGTDDLHGADPNTVMSPNEREANAVVAALRAELETLKQEKERMLQSQREWQEAVNLSLRNRIRAEQAEKRVAELRAAIKAEWNAPHIVHLAREGWRLQHPLRCRDDLGGCEWNAWCDENADDAVWEKGQGFFEIIDHGDEHVELKATEQRRSPLAAVLSKESNP